MIAGRYTLDREIGRGGAGVVWLGRDEVLGRQVALKRIGLLPGADQTDLARAEREAQLSARIHHPNVVAVFDVVVDADDAHWLVMEYVAGRTLAQLVVDHGPLAPDRAAPLLRQAADALVAAHAAGIAHRDVKPSNILVDADGRARLTDFGIARVSTDATLTQTGMVTGSPSYLAPEIATGSRGDAASDVWSLGATLFHVLAGRPPYETGGNVLSTLYKIVHEDPPQLPEAGVLAPVLAGTMVKDPAQRWSMTQVRDFLAGSRDLPTIPIAAPTYADVGTRAITEVVPPAPSPAPRRTPNRALLVGLVALLVVALGIGLWAALRGTGARTPGSAGSRGTSSAATSTSKPTAAGMERFIRSYVTAVADDPGTSWKMLTPKFQTESGGFDHYKSFWDPATNGRVTSISADPAKLSVSYQVHFDNWKNGPGPTVLDLTFQDGRYLIDGERTAGFTPAG